MAAAVVQQQGGALRRCLRAACFVLLVAVPLLQAFRGLNLTDKGFVLTNQRLVFSSGTRPAPGLSAGARRKNATTVSLPISFFHRPADIARICELLNESKENEQS